MEDLIRHTLATEYGLRPLSVNAVPGGWSAHAYAVRTAGDGYFVKIYDKRRASTRHWIARIDQYMPTVLWLHKNTPLRGRIIAPVLTTKRQYQVESRDTVMLVFPLIAGASLDEERLTAEQVRQLAEILAALHAWGDEIPVDTAALREDYALPFLDKLTAILEGSDTPVDLSTALAPYRELLIRESARLRLLAAALRTDSCPCVLCHTDVHGWNLMWDGTLTLIDWEGLRLAPAEADLFSFTEGFFFDYAAELFFQVYRAARPGYVINEQAMTFSRLRRRLEDIAEFAYSVACDHLPQEENIRSLELMDKECRTLQRQRS